MKKLALAAASLATLAACQTSTPRPVDRGTSAGDVPVWEIEPSEKKGKVCTIERVSITTSGEVDELLGGSDVVREEEREVCQEVGKTVPVAFKKTLWGTMVNHYIKAPTQDEIAYVCTVNSIPYMWDNGIVKLLENPQNGDTLNMPVVFPEDDALLQF